MPGPQCFISHGCYLNKGSISNTSAHVRAVPVTHCSSRHQAPESHVSCTLSPTARSGPTECVFSGCPFALRHAMPSWSANQVCIATVLRNDDVHWSLVMWLEICLTSRPPGTKMHRPSPRTTHVRGMLCTMCSCTMAFSCPLCYLHCSWLALACSRCRARPPASGKFLWASHTQHCNTNTAPCHKSYQTV